MDWKQHMPSVAELGPEHIRECGVCGLPTCVTHGTHYCMTCKRVLCATCRDEGHGRRCRDA